MLRIKLMDLKNEFEAEIKGIRRLDSEMLGR